MAWRFGSSPAIFRVAALGVLALSSGAAAQSDRLAIVGARVQPAPDAAPIMVGTIVASGGRISEVGPKDSVSVPRGAIEIAGDGRRIFRRRALHHQGRPGDLQLDGGPLTRAARVFLETSVVVSSVTPDNYGAR